ncbi:MAG TPA: Stp1/IreP family PP2C-type Ser/Thr phosphatase [Pyrinomonadaceae bacterium]|nr:Stp1/IreP family PP2C-type Ser/Thr phosphatase [Pyrinomonadaceae bacterium]
MENNFNITSGSVSDRGLSEKRPENEDSYLVLEDRGIYAVADGVGGAQAGDVASQMAVEILGEAFLNQRSEQDAEDVMRAAIEQANSAIYQMANELPQLSSMATTIVALHLNGNIATIGHVGDSRAYRLDRHGRLQRETNDHSVVEEEVRAGRMTPEQAANHPSKNIISRALGAELDVDIDLRTLMLEPGTTFLLCSDGITRHIADHEITSFLGMDTEPTDICARLKDLCYERGAEDNLTAVVVRVAGEPVEQYSAAAAGASAGDGEEMTVASARAGYVGGHSDSEGEEEFSNGDTISIDETELDDQSYLMEDSSEDSIGSDTKERLTDYSSSSLIVPAQPDPEPDDQTAATPRPSPYIVPRDIEVKSESGGSRLLSALLFLVLGGVLGMAVYYFWLGSTPDAQPAVETPVITEMKSTNPPLTAFEEGRRLVDKDPQAYINANAAASQDVDDYFLLGRAFMLTGKYWEAKRSFIEARNRLATADPNNAKTLASEISMALAIIESPQATESFTRDITTANAGTSANSNTNAAAPPATPIR